ncbi:MAG: protein O-mannosyl-transferase TMTC1-related protein, partial [Vicinamibacterales bacterium]
MSSRLLAAALCALTIAAYSNSFTGGFPFDNKQLILQDARVHDVSRANLDLILGHSYWWPYGESGLYRPVTTLSYLFNYALLGNGNRPAGYHAFNLAVHVVNVLLVYALLLALLNQAGAGPPFKGRRPAHGAKAASGRNRMGGPAASTSSNPAPAAPGFARVPAAFATAAIWAVHPLSTEAVTNIVGRADLLAALAVLGAFLLYLKARGEAGPRRLAWFAGVAAASALGFFSKESAVVIVPVIALYELVWWDGTRSRSALIWAAASLAAPLLLMWSQRSAVLGSSPAAEFAFVDNPIVGAGFWTGRLSAIAVMARYLALLVWPATLSNDYSYAQVPIVHGTARDWVACLAIAACAAGWLALSPWRARRNPGVVLAQRVAFFSAAFAFVTFLPASNLLFPTGTIMAERLMYLPSIGLVALLAIALLAAAARVFGSPGLAILAVAVLASGLSYRTWTRNPDWRDDVALWTSAVHAAPSSAKAHRALAEALYDTDPSHANIDRVIAEAERSVALLSPLPDRWNSYQSYRQAGAYYLDKAVAL